MIDELLVIYTRLEFLSLASTRILQFWSVESKKIQMVEKRQWQNLEEDKDIQKKNKSSVLWLSLPIFNNVKLNEIL